MKKENKEQIELLIETLINTFKKNKEKFVNDIIKSEENAYFQIMPAENPFMKVEFSCIKMKLQFTIENIDFYKLYNEVNKESEEK